MTSIGTRQASVLAAIQLAGLALVTGSLLLGIGVLWVQLGRALPLGELLHRPRAARAVLMAGVGLGLLFLGRRGPAIAGLKRLRLPSVEWAPGARDVIRLAGLALVVTGLLLGLAALWLQLGRALPLVELLHHPRAVQAMLMSGAGLGLLFLGRTRADVSQRPPGVSDSPPQRDHSEHDTWLQTG